jgi:hypothetical protein
VLLTQNAGAVQAPRVPPQRSGPHCPTAGVQEQVPATQTALVALMVAQPPQLPPQPSGPQDLPAQLGTQTHRPAWHWSWPLQVPQLPPQPLEPQARALVKQKGEQAHWPVELQAFKGIPVVLQTPQLLPQPSPPHCLPAQFGAQTQTRLELQVSWPTPQTTVESHGRPHPSVPHWPGWQT